MEDDDMARGLLTSPLLHVLWAGVAAAQLTSPPPKTPVLNSDNGHYYQLVLGTPRQRINFEEALARAATTSHLGIPGHLVTITSQAEQDFLASTFGYHSFWHLWFWIGASDAAVNGEWRWVAGPEAGQLFWLGDYTGTALGYQSWLYDSSRMMFYEPNDALGPGTENYAAMQLFDQPQFAPTFGRNSRWNDVSNNDRYGYGPVGYIIEFSPIPEPSTRVLVAIAWLGGVVCLANQFRSRPNF
jgi:hypothetical protein